MWLDIILTDDIWLCYAFCLYLLCRDYRGNRAALFDDIEEGGIRAASSYSSHEIDEHENDRALEGLSDRVLMLKRVGKTGLVNIILLPVFFNLCFFDSTI